MLGKQGIIPKQDSEAIVKSLETILADIESGALKIDMNAEDIHSFVESELVSRIGDPGRRLHTGRSRNDQVALDMRMYVKEEIDATAALLNRLLDALLETAKKTHRFNNARIHPSAKGAACNTGASSSGVLPNVQQGLRKA